MNTSGLATSFVDLHTHILPGVDDGPQTLEAAMSMLRGAAKSGTSVMVATPHGGRKALWPDVGHLTNLCQSLNELAGREQLPIKIVLGMENPLEMDLAAQVEKGRALTINGSAYILVELPFNTLPLYWEDVLFKLQVQGLRPIIAHAERQQQFQENIDLLVGPSSRGILVQITAGSLCGHFGIKAKKAAQTLAKKDLAHMVASDTHKPEGPRGPDLLAGFNELKKLVGEPSATRMMVETPASMLGSVRHA